MDLSLTTIEDLVSNPDGSRFVGVVAISSPAFTTSGGAAIAAVSLRLRVKSGRLYVQLAPTVGASPASAAYAVQYTSDVRAVRFQERWVVPVAGDPLGLADVRA